MAKKKKAPSADWRKNKDLCPYCKETDLSRPEFCSRCGEYISMNSIVRQTHWKRPYHLFLLMDECLSKIERYTYDFSNTEFLDYARRRGASEGIGKEGSLIRSFIENPKKDKKSFLQEACTLKMNNGKFVDEAGAHSMWTSVLYARGHLQDAWEIWCLSVKQDKRLLSGGHM